MENSFWFGYKLQDFLFPGFDIESPIGEKLCRITFWYNVYTLKLLVLIQIYLLIIAFSLRESIRHRLPASIPMYSKWNCLSLTVHFYSITSWFSISGLIAVCLTVVMLVCIFESLKTTKIIKKLRSNTLDNRSFFRLAFSRSTEKSNLIERQESVRFERYCDF